MRSRAQNLIYELPREAVVASAGEAGLEAAMPKTVRLHSKLSLLAAQMRSR
jgi:hypothetical protein